MILYFADRYLNILGIIGDKINRTSEIRNDSFEIDVANGIETLTFDIDYETNERKRIEKLCNVGNYILCYLGVEEHYKTFTIIDSEENTGENTMHIYAEDVGLDLINDMVGPYNEEKSTYNTSPNYAEKFKWRGYYTNEGTWVENNNYKASDYISIPEQSGGEYIIRNQKNSEYDSMNPTSDNYASNNYIEWNGYYDRSGTWHQDDDIGCTGYIPLSAEINYLGFRISRDPDDEASSRWYEVVFLNSNKGFISAAKYESFSSNIYSTWVEKPNNASFVIIAFDLGIPEILMFQYDNLCYEQTPNYKSNVRWNGYYNTAGTWYSNNNYGSTDYLDLEGSENEAIAIRTIQNLETPTDLWYAEVYFDKNKKFLETTYRYNQQGTSVETSRRPYDAKYVILSFDLRFIDIRMLPIRPMKWFAVSFFNSSKVFISQDETYSYDTEVTKRIYAPVDKGAAYMIVSSHRIYYDTRLVPSTVKLRTIDDYILNTVQDSGFSIGSNEFSSSDKKAIGFYNMENATERINDIAEEFKAEYSFSYDIKNLEIVGKYINLYKTRGYNNGIKLRLGKEVTNIRITKSVSNLATAIYPVGLYENSQGEVEELKLDRYEGTTDTANGYYVEGNILYSKKAYEQWARYTINGKAPGHIVKKFEYEKCKSREDLYERSLKDLKLLEKPTVEYEIELGEVPKEVGLGDTVYIIDAHGEVHDPARILTIKRSYVDESVVMTVGSLIKSVDGNSESTYSGGSSSSGGGSSSSGSSVGTLDYSLLENKPKINGTMVVGSIDGNQLLLVNQSDTITNADIDLIISGELNNA